MRMSLPKILNLPAHPWLIGAFPILYLYSENFGLVIDNEVHLCLFWASVVTTIGFFAAQAIARNIHKAAIITSSVSLFLSLSGHLHSLVAERAPLFVWTTTILLAMAIVVTVLHKLRSETIFEQITLPLNLFSLAMILMQMAALYSHRSDRSIEHLPIWNDELASVFAEPGPKAQDSKEMPDIYYIIPDAYPSDIWFREAMSYDNGTFTQALKDRGFIINHHAQSNYASTLLSLASTLNMTYIDRNPSRFADKAYLRALIADNTVARMLKQLGYTYVQFLSGYLVPSPIAEINRDFTPAGSKDIPDLHLLSHGPNLERAVGFDPHTVSAFYKRSFIALYLDTTLMKIIGDELHQFLLRDRTAPYDMYSPQRFLATLDELDSVVAMPEATFTLVHLLKPHIPTTFDEQGNIIKATKRPTPNEHFAELRFLNAKFLETIDRILKGSRHEPIIIFQSDHGSTYGNHTRGSLRIHFDAYSAYYAPAAYSLDIPQPHTFINTFPLILNTVFDAGLELRKNRLIERLGDDRAQFEQKDVTELYARW